MCKAWLGTTYIIVITYTFTYNFNWLDCWHVFITSRLPLTVSAAFWQRTFCTGTGRINVLCGIARNSSAPWTIKNAGNFECRPLELLIWNILSQVALLHSTLENEHRWSHRISRRLCAPELSWQPGRQLPETSAFTRWIPFQWSDPWGCLKGLSLGRHYALPWTDHDPVVTTSYSIHFFVHISLAATPKPLAVLPKPTGAPCGTTIRQDLRKHPFNCQVARRSVSVNSL